MKRLTIKSGEKLTFISKRWNDCYADEDRNACIRSVDGTSQDLRSFIKELWGMLIDKDEVFPEDDEEFDDWLDTFTQYETVEGLLAYLYEQMCGKADLQNTLKHFEDKAELEAINSECEPEYIEENTAVGCRVGKCKCGNIVKSYQKFCDECGIKLDWGNVRACLEQRTHSETLDNQANAIIKFEKEMKEELVELIINYSTTLKTALVIKDRDSIEQCVEEWIEERIKE